MDALVWLRIYAAANVVFVLAWLLVSAASIWSRRARPIAFSQQLRFGYAAIIVAVFMPLIGLVASGDYLPQTAQIWSASTMHAAPELPSADERITVSLAPAAASVALDRISLVLAGVFIVGLALGLARIAYGVVATRRVLADAQLIRHSGSLYVLASEAIAVPFSFWMPGRYFIAVPSSLLVDSGDLRVALRHEAQHHRQGDTRMLYALQLLLGLCFWNPALHALVRCLRELQEFACDEALLEKRGVAAQPYCACLLRIAEHACGQRAPLIAMSMADHANKSVFTRRIEHMLNRPQEYSKASRIAVLAFAGLAVLSMTAATVAATVKDRRITANDAQQMASAARANSAFPIVVNESVVQELNRYLGTPDGRQFVRESLVRMQAHRELIGGKLEQYGLPRELMAVPLVESGYRNLPSNQSAVRAAGLWQFIEPTARRYSLRVDARTDERLDVLAETNAAVRMFSDLHRHFGDWGLALLAFNAGNSLVEQGIRETGSRDVWSIVGSGYENDRDYMPRVMAAILIMQNPDVVE